jgi:hypothetical protein
VLQASGCGEAEVVILVVDKYHCIPFDGHAAFGVQVNVNHSTINNAPYHWYSEQLLN